MTDSEQKKARECEQITAERFLAREGFADSRPHSSTDIAAIMERYASELRAELATVRAELARVVASANARGEVVETLRNILRKCVESLGGATSPEVSNEFLSQIPADIIALREQLEKKKTELLELATVREELEKKQETLDRVCKNRAEVAISLAQVSAERDRLREAATKFGSYDLTVRLNNQREWMEYFCEEANALCEALGESDRFTFDGDGLRRAALGVKEEGK